MMNQRKAPKSSDKSINDNQNSILKSIPLTKKKEEKNFDIIKDCRFIHNEKLKNDLEQRFNQETGTYKDIYKFCRYSIIILIDEDNIGQTISHAYLKCLDFNQPSAEMITPIYFTGCKNVNDVIKSYTNEKESTSNYILSKSLIHFYKKDWFILAAIQINTRSLFRFYITDIINPKDGDYIYGTKLAGNCGIRILISYQNVSNPNSRQLIDITNLRNAQLCTNDKKELIKKTVNQNQIQDLKSSNEDDNENQKMLSDSLNQTKDMQNEFSIKTIPPSNVPFTQYSHYSDSQNCEVVKTKKKGFFEFLNVFYKKTTPRNKKEYQRLNRDDNSDLNKNAPLIFNYISD
ncbi:hypothetical protein M9Y10_028538 [Tritrichomonas musculus]|uniref:Uncharacterized protein n=1 Tax=Tritrichomonas musculus TaxID=1915356 RepID=A0ABR2KJL8_9EUKA